MEISYSINNLFSHSFFTPILILFFFTKGIWQFVKFYNISPTFFWLQRWSRSGVAYLPFTLRGTPQSNI